MLKWVVESSLRFGGVVIVVASLVAVYGIYVAGRVKLDVFPEFAPPQIVIQTEAPGLSAEEVEALVTRPVEYALNGTPELEVIYSQSIQGLSVVTTIFREDADIYRVRQLTGERLAELTGQLPEGVEAPRLGPLSSSTSLTLALGLVSDERTPMELRTFADWTVRLRLLGVPGVARVEVFGGEVRQIQIQVKPERLIAYRLSIDDVLAAARKSTGVRGAGFIQNENQRIVLRTKGQALSPEALGEVVLAHHAGFSVRLKDVASVVEGPEPTLGGGQVMGRPAIVMLVHSQYGANTLEVTRAVEATLGELKPLFAAEQVTLHPALFRPANFIEASIRNINQSLLIGGVLVIAVLFFFLANLRSAFIAITTIPLSLLAAVIVLEWFGASLNTITLGGFAISIGVVVDAAIVGLENVWRRLRENRTREHPKSFFSVVLDASLEVCSPSVYATFIIAAVFWPVLTMSGVNGRLFAPLGVAFILATLASLVVAITLTPALCYLLLARARATEPAYIVWLKRRHRRCLEAVSRRPTTVIGATLAICVAAAAAVPFFGGEFLPEFKEGHYIIRLLMAPGTSTQASLKIGTAITEELLKNPRIRSVSQQVGRAEQGEDTAGPEFSEFHVELPPLAGEEEERVKDEIRAALENFPGVTFAITPFLEERIEEILSGGRGEVVINLFGDDLRVLDRKAEEVRQLMATISGARDLLLQAQSGSPEVTVSLRHDRLKQFGFQPVDVLEAIQTAYQGTVVAQAYDNNRVFDVTVILDPASRRDPEAIGTLFVRNAAKTRLPLRELAEVGYTAGRDVIVHEATLRRQQVTCDVEGRDVASFAAEVKRKIQSQIAFPPGVFVAYGGVAEAQTKARRELLFHSTGAAVGIVLLLSMVFANSRNMLLVLVNLPFALAGGVLAAFLSGGSLSIGSLVGFVSLFGISMRNSILMISHYEDLVAQEGMEWGLDAAVRGATERLLPILMTALLVALALLPIAIGSAEAGHEIEGPMAIVILGGLLTSTVLNLLVLPTLALRYGRFERRESPA
ncbi:MAG: Cobalt-zinc-cadmium resistance protein CzcA [Chromatiales bacterium USCg_Taylor]|nr:MAG: Cobalt-zinc-cadmium resistance protein CzcA [Chromatiales bacterium USCg_Taylor]